MGAWYVISSLGLFDIKGLTDTEPSFALGSPLFDKITIQLNEHYYKGKSFVIETKENNDTNTYVQRFVLNGRPLTVPRIPFRTIATGGRLEMDMGNRPVDHY